MPSGKFSSDMPHTHAKKNGIQETLSFLLYVSHKSTYTCSKSALYSGALFSGIFIPQIIKNKSFSSIISVIRDIFSFIWDIGIPRRPSFAHMTSMAISFFWAVSSCRSSLFSSHSDVSQDIHQFTIATLYHSCNNTCSNCAGYDSCIGSWYPAVRLSHRACITVFSIGSAISFFGWSLFVNGLSGLAVEHHVNTHTHPKTMSFTSKIIFFINRSNIWYEFWSIKKSAFWMLFLIFFCLNTTTIKHLCNLIVYFIIHNILLWVYSSILNLILDLIAGIVEYRRGDIDIFAASISS